MDAVVGALPVVGDAFDAAGKANVRNVRLLEAGPRRRARRPTGGSCSRWPPPCSLFVLALVAAATVAAWWLLGRFG